MPLTPQMLVHNCSTACQVYIHTSSLSDLRLMDELRRGFFTPPVLVLVLALVLLCGS